MKNKISMMMLIIATLLLVSPLASRVETNELSSQGGDVAVFSVPTEVYRNGRRVNYRVIRDWYFVSDFTIGLNIHGTGPSRSYKIYWRNVSYDVVYDVYSATGRYLRTDRQSYSNIIEEQWRLQ